jgi:hypothetical protein
MQVSLLLTRTAPSVIMLRGQGLQGAAASPYILPVTPYVLTGQSVALNMFLPDAIMP